MTGPAPPAMTPERPGPELPRRRGRGAARFTAAAVPKSAALKGGHVRALLMEGHPLDGHTFGAPGTITHLADL